MQNNEDIARVVDEQKPDFLIIALDEPERRPALCDFLLRQYPDMKILALAPDRNISLFFWASLDIHSDPIEASEEGVIRALKSKIEPVESDS